MFIQQDVGTFDVSMDEIDGMQISQSTNDIVGELDAQPPAERRRWQQQLSEVSPLEVNTNKTNDKWIDKRMNGWIDKWKRKRMNK